MDFNYRIEEDGMMMMMMTDEGDYEDDYGDENGDGDEYDGNEGVRMSMPDSLPVVVPRTATNSHGNGHDKRQ